MNRPLIRFAATAIIAALGIATAFAGSGGGTRLFVGESIPVIDKAIVTPAPQPQQKTRLQQSTTPAAKPTQGSKPKSGTKPGPRPRTTTNAGVVYYNSGIEVNMGQVQQAAQELQPLVEQVMQNMPSDKQIQEMARQLQGPATQRAGQAMRNMPSDKQIQEMARQLQGPVTQQVEQAMRNMPSVEEIQEMARQLQEPVTQQVEQAVQQLPEPMQETLNEPIIITPRSVNAGNVNGNRNGSRSRSTRRSSDWTYGIPGMTGGNGNGPLIYNP